LIFRDPRRDTVDTSVSYLKTMGVLSAIAYGGVRLSTSFTSSYRDAKRLVASAKSIREDWAQAARLFPEIEPEEIKKLLPNQRIDPIVPAGVPDIDRIIDTDEYKRLSQDNLMYSTDQVIEEEQWEKKAAKLLTDDDLIRDYSLYEPHVRQELIDKVDTLNQKMSLTGSETPWELSKKMTEVTSAKNTFLKEYSTLPSILTDNGVNIEKISSDGSGYTIKIKHAESGKFATVNLPSYKGGMIQKGVTDWLPTLSAEIVTAKEPGAYWDVGQKILVHRSFGSELLEEAQKIIGARFHMIEPGMNPAQVVANSLSNAVDSLLSRAEEAGRVSKLGGITSDRFILKEVLEAKQKPGTKSARAIKSTYAQLVEGIPVVTLSVEGELKATGREISMAGISEAAYVKSGKIATAPVIGAFPYTPLNAQSHLRPTYAKKLVSGEQLSVNMLSRILGPTSTEVLEKISKEIGREAIPGKMVNIGFWLDELYGVGEGSVAMVVDTRIKLGENIDPTAKFSTKQIENILSEHGLNQSQIDQVFDSTTLKTNNVYKGGITINDIKDKVKDNKSIKKEIRDMITLGRKRGSTILDTFSSVNMSIIDVKEFTKDEAGKAFIHPITKDLILNKLGGEFGKEGAISKSLLKGNEAPVVIKKGQPLGIDPVSNEMKFADKNLKLIRMEVDNGLIRFIGAEDIPLAPGRTKLSTTKAIVNKITTREELGQLMLSEGVFDKEAAKLYAKGQIPGAANIIMSANQMKKLHGGGIDLGIMNKMLGDIAKMKSIEIETWIKQGRISESVRGAHIDTLKKGLREVMVYMMDRDGVDTVLDKLEIDAGGELSIKLKNGISTAHDKFKKLSIMESLILKSQTGNQAAIQELHRVSENLQKMVKSTTGVDYTMSVGLKQYNKLLQSPGDTIKNMPVLVFGDNGTNLKGVFTRTFEATHLVSIDNFTKFSGEDRGLNGFSRGRRQGMDDMINAHASGLKHLEHYYSAQLDYKFPYILDKYEAASDWLSDKQFSTGKGADTYKYNNGQWVSITTGREAIGVGATGKKKMAVLSLNDIRGIKNFGNEDFVTRLVTEYENTSNISAASRFRIVMDNMKDMAMFTDDADIADLIKNNNLSIEQLTSHGMLGGRGNSALIESEVMEELMKVFNSVPDDAVLYMKLPMEVDINGKKTRYVPMHKFDKSDIFELAEHRTGPDLATIDREVIGSFFTGSDFVTNQVNYVRQIAKIEEELRLHAGNDTVKKEAMAQLRVATADKSAAIRASFTGKHSAANRRLIENSIPFTMQGKVISAEGIPFGVSAVSADDAVKFFTGGVVDSMDMATKLTNEIDTVNILQDSLKKVANVFDHATSGEALDNSLTELLEGLAGIKSKVYTKDIGNLTDTIVQYWNASRQQSILSKEKVLTIPGSIVKRFPTISDSAGSKTTKITPNILTNIKDKLGTYVTKHTTNIQERIDERAKVMATGKMATDVLKDLGMEWSEDNMYMKYPGLNSTKYFPGSRVVRPNQFVSTNILGYPLLSSAATKDLQLSVINEKGVSQKLMEELPATAVKDIHKMHNAPIYINSITADSMARDFDGDLVFMENRALDYLEDKRSQIDNTISLSKSLNMTSEDFKNLSHESMINGIQERLAIVGPDNELLPANRQSIKMMYSISEGGYQNRIVTRSVTDEIDRILQEYNISGTEATQVRKKIYNNIRTSTTGFLNVDHANIQDLINIDMAVVSRISTPDETERAREIAKEKHKAKSLLTEAGSEQEMLKLYPDTEYNILVDKLTPEKRIIHQAMIDDLKSQLPQLRKEMQLTQVSSFINIKEGTPPSYKLRAAIRHISANFTNNEREKAFLDLLASETIAQKTISSKHGTPDVLDDLLDTFRKLSNKNISLDDNIFEKVSRYNFSVNLAPEISEEMEEWGMKQPGVKVDYDTYEDYLSKKKEYLTKLTDVNHNADLEMVAAITEGKSDIRTLKNTRVKHIDGKMQNYKMVNRGGESKKIALKYWGYGSALAEEKLTEVDTWIQNAKKHRRSSILYKTFSRGMPGADPNTVWENTTREIKPYVKKMTKSFREFHELHGTTIMEDRGYAAITKFSNDGVSTLDVIKDLEEKLSKGESIQTSSMGEKRIAEFSAWVRGEQDIRTTNVDYTDRMNNLVNLHNREKKDLIKLRAERIAQESTVFRAGSVFDAITEGTIKHTASAADDQLIRSAGKLRIGTILAGLLTGVIAGQTVNQITKGYAVPDLEKTAGLGGEYYEDSSGIMGREMEIMLKPRPAKIVSQYQDGMGVSGAARHIHDMFTVLSPKPQGQGEYRSKYRGVVVG